MFIGAALFVSLYMVLFSQPVTEFNTTNLLLTLLYGVFWLTLISFGTQWGVTQLEAGRASIIIVMELVAAVISAVWLLPDTLSLIELVGIIMVVTAALVEGMRETVVRA
jgi:drug/metabolite transporter (DMT)-like permease